MGKSRRNVISFLNMKGGVCKTTLCKEMGLFMSENFEKKILIVDIDPQSNCTQSFYERFNVLEVEEGELIKHKSTLPSIENVFNKSFVNEDDSDNIIYRLTERLHIIPGDLKTVFMERETATGASEQRLLNFIDEYELKSDYDYIFIDCPPTYSFYTVSALLTSDYYFVPLKPDAYSLLGLDLLEKVVSELRKSYRTIFKNNPINNLGVIFTMIPKVSRVKIEKNMQQLRETYEEKNIYFFNNVFPKAEKLSTGKLSKFIIDRDDEELQRRLESICKEFEKRIGVLNGEDS